MLPCGNLHPSCSDRNTSRFIHEQRWRNFKVDRISVNKMRIPTCLHLLHVYVFVVIYQQCLLCHHTFIGVCWASNARQNVFVILLTTWRVSTTTHFPSNPQLHANDLQVVHKLFETKPNIKVTSLLCVPLLVPSRLLVQDTTFFVSARMSIYLSYMANYGLFCQVSRLCISSWITYY